MLVHKAERELCRGTAPGPDSGWPNRGFDSPDGSFDIFLPSWTGVASAASVDLALKQDSRGLS